MRPESAVLLAAGRGERLRPHTDRIPKPLLPAAGGCALERTLRAVRNAGIRRVCVVTHHLEEQIRDFVGDGSRWGLRVECVRQARLRGSGDALLAARAARTGLLDLSAPVLVSATDYLLPPDAFSDLVRAYEENGWDIAVSLKECPPEEWASRSLVELAEGWRVTRIVEKPAPGEIAGPYTASLIYILPPAIWEYLPRVQPSPRGEIELPAAVNLLLTDGFRARGVLQPAPAEWQPPAG